MSKQSESQTQLVAARLTEQEKAKARRIGTCSRYPAGNVSAGIRLALQRYEEWERWQDNRQETTT